MTVVLLDPLRPDMIPVAARTHLSGEVLVTEEVPTGLLWELDHFAPALAESDPSTTLVSTDITHPLVAARIAQGDRVIRSSASAGRDLLDAVALMDLLRRNGPWESRQTHASLRRYLLEEVYELLDAIDAGDQENLREELGDLLLQVLFHARIAADDPTDPFDIDAVARSFTAKVSGRTPGVLSGAHSDLETQIREWEEHKAAEKNRGSVLDGIATTQPALALTQKVLERLSAAGYPIERIAPDVVTVTVTAAEDSVEAATRQRTLDLMAHVRAVEEQARIDGIDLTTPEAWHAVLDGSDAVEGRADQNDASGAAGAEVAGEEEPDADGVVADEVVDAEVIDEAAVDEGVVDQVGAGNDAADAEVVEDAVVQNEVGETGAGDDNGAR
ncbi:nucleoside triphosphate pyrophosphohydrolase [Gordonia sinesedis]